MLVFPETVLVFSLDSVSFSSDNVIFPATVLFSSDSYEFKYLHKSRTLFSSDNVSFSRNSVVFPATVLAFPATVLKGKTVSFWKS